MGLFTPRYPKSDTPGATSTPTKRSRRRPSNNTPASAGITTDQLRGLATHDGGTLDVRGNTATIRVDQWDTKAQITTQRYVKRSDGTWVAA
ncbi:hypothetical protein [Streptomyces africanus]|uniref:hypothetical protein n=1 Tax=Streptomyces africanus TaxID=231024 RepID=UPI000A385012|nr:hypothetical protein [Streptomyces africanus]